MANYSTDTEMKEQHGEIDIGNWLSATLGGTETNFGKIRDVVTTRINEHIKKQGKRDDLRNANVIDVNGNVDLAKIANPQDFRDIENHGVLARIYESQINDTADDANTVVHKAMLYMERFTNGLRYLVVHIDVNQDSIAEDSVHVGRFRISRG